MLEANINNALSPIKPLDEAYQAASPNIRQLFNQAILEGIHIDVDGRIAYVRMAGPFNSFLDEDFLAQLTRELKNPGHAGDRGSNNDTLVEVRGFEPLTS